MTKPERRRRLAHSNNYMNIFIFEHVCGGAMVDEGLPKELADQGAAMLGSAVSEFIEFGARVLTTLDHRVDFALNADVVKIIETGKSIEPVFDQLVQEADAALVIAPECDGALERYACRLEQLGAVSLGCDRRSIALCADKLAMARHFEAVGIATPPTVPFLVNEPIETPAVIKPRFGAGCENTFLWRSVDDFARGPTEGEWVVQPFVDGTSCSVSLIVSGSSGREATRDHHIGTGTRSPGPAPTESGREHRKIPLMAGRQCISQHGQPIRLRYDGGHMPLDAALWDRAMDLSTRAASTVPGLSGFVGVDLVLAENPNEDVVIEINPRLTVSFVVLRHLAKTNLAELIVQEIYQDITVILPAFSDEPITFDKVGNWHSVVKS